MGTRLLVKLLLRVALPALLAVAVIVALVRFDLLAGPLRALAEDLGIMSRETVSTSEVMLEELGEIYRLETVEYIYRTVFPYDYMPDSTSMAEVMRTIRETTAPLDEALTEDQKLYFDAYNLAEDIGLSEEEFLVLTVRVFAGFELAGTPFAGPADTGAPADAAVAADDYVRLEPLPDGEGRRARVRLPQPTVTDIVIEDVDPATYRYPDVGMDAEGWRRVAGFMSEHVEARTIEDGILDSAGANARELVRTLLLSAGIDQVSFENEANSDANSEDRR